jgi:hypothetical protein
MNLNLVQKISEAIFIQDTNLPFPVFKKKFDTYIFFDESLRGTHGVATGIKNLIECSTGNILNAVMLTSIDNKFLTCLDSTCDWEIVFKEIHRQQFDKSEMDSFAIASTNEDWALFQKWPVDVGIIGLTRQNNISHALKSKHVDFFLWEDIRDWINPKINHDVDYNERYGNYFLMQLLENYQPSLIV